MGTPHVHCMSKLPTAHEPPEGPATAPGDRDRVQRPAQQPCHTDSARRVISVER